MSHSHATRLKSVTPVALAVLVASVAVVAAVTTVSVVVVAVAVVVAAVAAPAAWWGLRGATADDQMSTVSESPAALDTQDSIHPASRSAVVSNVSR